MKRNIEITRNENIEKPVSFKVSPLYNVPTVYDAVQYRFPPEHWSLVSIGSAVLLVRFDATDWHIKSVVGNVS